MELILAALLVALLSVRAVGGNVPRARAWAVLSLAVTLLALRVALPWSWTWPLPELGAVVVSCALLGGLGGWLLLPVCERMVVGFLRWNARVGLVSEDEARSQQRLSAAAQEGGSCAKAGWRWRPRRSPRGCRWPSCCRRRSPGGWRGMWLR